MHTMSVCLALRHVEMCLFGPILRCYETLYGIKFCIFSNTVLPECFEVNSKLLNTDVGPA